MSTFKEHEIPAQACFRCGEVSDAAFGVQPDAPKPGAGDVLICLFCGQLSIVNDDLAARMPTIAEARNLMGIPDVLRAMVAAKKYQEKTQRGRVVH